MIVRDCVTDALRLIGVEAGDEAAQAYDITTGARALDSMLRAWQNEGYNLWTTASQTVTLVADTASYSITRALRIHSARLSQDGIETDLFPMTRNDYDLLPDKTSSGTPCQYYIDRQSGSGTLYLWPVPDAADSVVITYERELADMTDITATVDVVREGIDAVVYNLADRLSDSYEVDKPKVTARAAALKMRLNGADREESVYFSACDDYE